MTAKPPFNVYSGLEFPSYSYQEFPKWVRNAQGEQKIVNTREELVEFVGDFVDTSSESPLEKQVRELQEANARLQAEISNKDNLSKEPAKSATPATPTAPVEKPKG